MDVSPSAPVWRRRIFALTWLSYFSYYFTRKNYSVIKSSLALSSSQLTLIETVYTSAYALGQFINGALADVIGPRRLIAAGMLSSAALAVLFGFGSSLPLFVIAFGLNGLVQASGWPGNGRAMASWFSTRERGEIMGYWGTCYQAGGLVATTFATFLMDNLGWRSALFGPALWVAVVGVAIMLWLRDSPSKVGLPDPDLDDDIDVATGRELHRRAWSRVVRNPMTWAMGANYFCMKLTRYSLIFWLPFYLHTALGYSKAKAGYMSTSFEIGGVIGVITAGLIADRLCGRRRIAVAAVMTALLSGALAIYAQVGGQSDVANFLAMMLVGALLFGPDSLVSGAVSQDIGGPHGAALACGMINGLGSLGAILQGFMTDYVSRTYGWDMLFVIFQLLAVVATLTLLPFFAVTPRSESNPS